MIGIYGAHGFIGRHLVQALSRRSLAIRAVSRCFNQVYLDAQQNKIECISLDLNSHHIYKTLDGISTVVQLASSSSPGLGNINTVADIETDLVPHVQFIQHCGRVGVKRYIFLSSAGTIYGNGCKAPVAEDAATNPINSYGILKLTIEKYIQALSRSFGMEYLILRPSNVYGPGQRHQRGQGLIPAVLESWAQRRTIKIFGDGSAIRDFLYVDDLVRAIEASIDLPGAPTAILNVASGQSVSINQLLCAVENEIQDQLHLEYIQSRSTDVTTGSFDISLARSILNWEPRIALRSGLARTVSFFAASKSRSGEVYHKTSA